QDNIRTFIYSHPNDKEWQYFSSFLVRESSPVPEPTTVILFGIGLLGLAGVNRRKQ
ncbi:MAG: PEP-CTERM sorting domain-containing protein, partial [Desulfobacteraceae bacterium]|nr:PEP-CTERM sorting domain-containing protein [Desulfobacteraceae bacterium]